MGTKLTLKLDAEVIAKAKEYAAAKNFSLSRLIESYLKSITSDREMTEEFEISPFVKSISTGISVPVNIDYKKEYRDHLAQKHK